jgi:hypothetical protein
MTQQSTWNGITNQISPTNNDLPPPVNRATKPIIVSPETTNIGTNLPLNLTIPNAPISFTLDSPPPVNRASKPSDANIAHSTGYDNQATTSSLDRSSKPDNPYMATTTAPSITLSAPNVVDSLQPPPLPPKSAVSNVQVNDKGCALSSQVSSSLEFPLPRTEVSVDGYEVPQTPSTLRDVSPKVLPSSSTSASETPPPLPPRETFSPPPLPSKAPQIQPQQQLPSTSTTTTISSSEIEQLRLEQLRIEQEKQTLAMKNQELKEQIRRQQQQTGDSQAHILVTL